MRRGFALTGTTAVLVGLVLAAGSTAAAMQRVPETGHPARLVLSSSHSTRLVLSPGEPVHWRVDAWLEEATTAELEVEVHSTGDVAAHPRGLRLDVRRCDVPWQDGPAAPTCAAGERGIVAFETGTSTGAPGTGPQFGLDPLVPGEREHLLVTLAVEDSAEAAADESLMGLTNAVGLGLYAVALDDVPVPTPSGPPGAPVPPGARVPPAAAGAPGGSLPRTGGAPVLLALAAAAALALGGGLLRAARRDDAPVVRRG